MKHSKNTPHLSVHRQCFLKFRCTKRRASSLKKSSLTHLLSLSVGQKLDNQSLDLSDDEELREQMDMHSIIVSTINDEPLFTAEQVPKPFSRHPVPIHVAHWIMLFWNAPENSTILQWLSCIGCIIIVIIITSDALHQLNWCSLYFKKPLFALKLPCSSTTQSFSSAVSKMLNSGGMEHQKILSLL